MPLKSAQDALERELTAAMNASSPVADPLIFSDGPSPPEAPTQLYVVWSKWGAFDDLKRSEIILNAYEAHAGIAKTLKVTLAMGLTFEQAADLKLIA